jgi:hypothetical protein
MFGSLAELLDWSERYGVRPVVYKGPEGSARGSVEVSKDLPASGAASSSNPNNPISHVPGAGATTAED